MSLLERISELRKTNGNISINKLEKEAGLSRGSMAKWDAHAPSPDKLKKVAEYFGVSVDYLLTGRDKKETPPAEARGAESEADLQLREFAMTADPQELEDVMKYIEFIKSKRANK